MVNLSSLLSDMGGSLYDSAGDEQTNALWGLLNGQRGFQPQGQGFQPQGQGQGLPPVTGGPTISNPAVSQEIIDPNTIGVMGTRVQQDFGQDGMEPPPGMGNRAWIEEARAALGGAPERRGLFGTKGTLRNILGSLGDAFLVGSGAQPMYAPQREREQLSDAMTGITQGGQEAMNAIERMAQVNPDAAAKMYDQVVGQQAKAQQIQQAQAQAQAAAAKAARESLDKGSQIASRMAGNIVDDESYQRNKPRLQNLIDVYQLSEFIKLPEKYDAGFIKDIREGGLETSKQITSAQGDRRLDQGDVRNDISQQNATSNRIRANRPPAGRAPARVPMRDQLLAEIQSKGWEGLTGSQRDAAKAAGLDPSKAGRGDSTRLPPLQRQSGTGSRPAPRKPTIKW